MFFFLGWWFCTKLYWIFFTIHHYWIFRPSKVPGHTCTRSVRRVWKGTLQNPLVGSSVDREIIDRAVAVRRCAFYHGRPIFHPRCLQSGGETRKHRGCTHTTKPSRPLPSKGWTGSARMLGEIFCSLYISFSLHPSLVYLFSALSAAKYSTLPRILSVCAFIYKAQLKLDCWGWRKPWDWRTEPIRLY